VTARIELAEGAEDNGLANMLSTIMRQNLEDHPERLVQFRKMRGAIAVFAEDAEVAVTIEADGDRAVFKDGVVGIPDVTVRGGFEQIGDMSRMESLGPIPDPRGPVNRAMAKAVRDGQLKVYGLPRGLPLLLAFGDVMAIH
jgi:hypothetical protein